MFDASNELKTYYENHLRLGTQLRNDLAGYRDLNLQRITDGLKLLGEKNSVTYRTWADYKNQGSYAMHTLNQCEHTDYDIDVAIIFEKDDLPANAADARIRIRDALQEKTKGTNFSKDPDARKNAVTVWYSDGYHIDFAVYRRRTDWLGKTVIEHAGGDEWTERDPMAYTNWFTGQVDSKSPPTMLQSALGMTVTLPKGQLRRIVRFVKAFARSRSAWALPGGITITTLVCEVYKQHATRDDVALVDTLQALLARLKGSVQVENPVQPGVYFTSSDRRRREVERLRDELEAKLPSLDVLYQADCTRKQAMGAWDAIFWHDYWSDVKKEAACSALGSTGLAIECWLSKKSQGPVYKQHKSDSTALPKGVHLRFTAVPDGVAPPYDVRWAVRNEGHEAKEDRALEHDTMKSVNEPYWTSTAYKGRHKMICEVIKDGITVRRGEHLVRIGPGRRFF
ncbi:hypothetical protein SAMN05428957_102264 [Oryzisolibacter propanilivorax]|uniref:Cyclic GMP-AMP synthase n=1 Tax=Oryzisolibacter propanilivorax TaxID=1527607 RepID=A0A1G9QE89_9BURK|nr:hypothetical protein [Oryzisolibacter propanilivorax]SDM09392.1 hypothetical protein SAMN05428957_102264 [Oryzisolibacter propanilivorax]